MSDKKYIFYNSSNKEFAKENRKNQTKQEWLVRHTILKQKKTWHKRVRQKMIWPYICDFYCSKLLLCIEIDWKYHEETREYDEAREKYMKKKGIMTIRYSNEQVDQKLNAVRKDIMKEIDERQK